MYASTITSIAFDAAFARYDRECQLAEDREQAFLAYCDERGWDPEDPEAEVWFDAWVEAEREAEEYEAGREPGPDGRPGSGAQL